MAGDYKYQRALLKLSGEALAGDAGTGVDNEILSSIARQIADLVRDGVQIAVVIGGGNFFRGVSGASKGMDRGQADSVGMLATVMNSLMLGGALEREGVDARVMSALDMPEVCEQYIRRRAISHLEKGRVVICAAGTGNPYFTTDTAGALRACELEAQVMMKATKVDGVYDKDPKVYADAKKYDVITYADVLAQGLKVMDATATSLCMDNNMPVLVFNMFEEGNIALALRGEAVGTVVE